MTLLLTNKALKKHCTSFITVGSLTRLIKQVMGDLSSSHSPTKKSSLEVTTCRFYNYKSRNNIVSNFDTYHINSLSCFYWKTLKIIILTQRKP